MTASDLPNPVHARNMRLIGHSDQGGRPDGVQLMVHRGYAYVGHMFSKGFSVLDVRDPRRPAPVAYIAAPPNTWNIHLQAHDDLLLVIHAKDTFAQPDAPRQSGFMPVEGGGLHRAWYIGGRWAYASALIDGFSDYILITIDMADPTKPRLAGRFWLPGMNVAAGETANWPSAYGRYGLHHPIVHGDIAYC